MNTDNLVHLREQLNSVSFAVAEKDRLLKLLQDQFETVAVRIDPAAPWGKGNRAPVRGVILTGGSLAGKSDLAEQCLEILDPVRSVDGEVIEPNNAIIDAPSLYTQAGQARAMLVPLGYPATRKMSPSMAWEKVRSQLPLARLTGMMIDNFQWAFAPSFVGRHRMVEEKVRIQGAYAGILDDPHWPMPLILVGRSEIKNELEAEAMSFFRERCDLVEIEAIRIDNKEEKTALAEGLAQLCEKAKLEPNIYPKDNLFGRLIHSAGGQRGLAIVTVKLAVIAAVKNGSSRLELSHFRAVYEEHTGSNNPDLNPFSSDAWHTINTGELARNVTMSELLRPMNRTPRGATNV